MSTRPGIPNIPPALIVGTKAVQDLHAAGFRIVPSVATSAMKTEATAVMLRRQKDGLPWVGTRDKHGMRWEAMLSVWSLDYSGFDRGKRARGKQSEPEAMPCKRWRIGKWFELEIGWRTAPRPGFPGRKDNRRSWIGLRQTKETGECR